MSSRLLTVSTALIAPPMALAPGLKRAQTGGWLVTTCTGTGPRRPRGLETVQPKIAVMSAGALMRTVGSTPDCCGRGSLGAQYRALERAKNTLPRHCSQGRGQKKMTMDRASTIPRSRPLASAACAVDRLRRPDAARTRFPDLGQRRKDGGSLQSVLRPLGCSRTCRQANPRRRDERLLWSIGRPAPPHRTPGRRGGAIVRQNDDLRVALARSGHAARIAGQLPGPARVVRTPPQ